MTTPIPVIPDDMRSAEGIAQTDIIVRTAILAGLDDLRANPDLLDYVFASLPKDPLTFREYGEQQVKLAKEWFLSQDIPVFLNTRLDESKVPSITIAMNASAEAQATLGDVNYQPQEPALSQPSIAYYGPFTPVSYDVYTGQMKLPADAADAPFFVGMLIRDAVGATHAIVDIVDDTTIVLDAGIVADFKNSMLISAQKYVASMESLDFRETFEIGCHAAGEPTYLTYLHSIVVFILLRYKEELLEGRGLERTTISSGPVVLNTSFSITQPVFSRMITMTGFVRQFWPKFIRGPVEGIETTVTTTEEIHYTKRGVIPAAYPNINPDET